MSVELQLELSLRLLFAALLGFLIGFERELHEHPAGMRTHMLVALGCALFTVMSIYGFAGAPAGTAPVEPSRIAAQIVTGMGFIGAGAILKYGTSIRGLTTAASLWSTAAIGIAGGAGQYLLAVVGAALVVLSLRPLQRVARLVRVRNRQLLRVRLAVPRLDLVGDIATALHDRHVAIEGLHTHRRDAQHFELELELRVPSGTTPEVVVTTIDAVPDVELLETDRAVE